MDGSAPADTDDVESIRADTRRLVELDTRYGGDDLVRLAVRATSAADEQLAAGCRARTIESDLQAAVGELAQVAAWIAYDADQQQLSRRLTNEALLHSRLAGDRRMELFELAQLAMQSIHLERPGEALRIADEVIDNARTGPRVAAVFHVRRARALAQLGDRSGALDEHDRAAAVLRAGDASSHDPDWMCGSMTPNSPDTEPCPWSALTTGPTPSTSSRPPTNSGPRPPHAPGFNDLAHLVAAQVAVRTWPDAETSLAQLAADAASVRSGRTTALLRRVLRQIGTGGAASPRSIVDSGEQLALVLDGRTD